MWISKKHYLVLLLAVMYPASYGVAGFAELWNGYEAALRGVGNCSDAFLEMELSTYSISRNWVGIIGIWILPAGIVSALFSKRAPFTIFLGFALGSTFAILSIDSAVHGVSKHCSFSKDLENGGVLMFLSHFLIYMACVVEWFVRAAIEQHRRRRAAISEELAP